MTLPPFAAKKSQCTTLLEQLRANGPRGIHSLDLRRDHGVGNPSQRIADLEALGHVISSERERFHTGAMGCRYRLVTDAGGTGTGARHTAVPSVQAVPELVEGELGPRLFEVETPDPLSPYSEAA